MLKIAIIIGSTRSGRLGEAVGKWAYEIAQPRSDADFGLLDLAQFNPPLLDEALPASFGQYTSRTHADGRHKLPGSTAMYSSRRSTTTAFRVR